VKNHLKRVASVASLVQKLRPAHTAKRVEALETAFAGALRRQLTETAAANIGSTIDWQWMAHYVSMFSRVRFVNLEFAHGDGQSHVELDGTHFIELLIEPGKEASQVNIGENPEYAATRFIQGAQILHGDLGVDHLNFHVGGEASLVFPDSPDIGRSL